MEFVSSETPRGGDTWHIVQKGQTLFSISRQYEVSLAQIRALNSMEGNTIHAGQRLLIKKGPAENPVTRGLTSGEEETVTRSGKDDPNARVPQAVVEPPVFRKETHEPETKTITVEKNKYYQVKKGDDLNSIADTYEVSPDQIKEWNYTEEIRPGDVIIVGKTKTQVEVEPTTRSGNETHRTTKYGHTTTPVDRSMGQTRGVEDVPKSGYQNQPVKKTGDLVMPLEETLRGGKMEKGKYIATGHDPNVTDTRFYGYHKSLPIGTKVRLDIPDNTGFVEVTIVGRLRKSVDAMIGLSPASVLVLSGSGAATGEVAIVYDL